MTFSWRTRRLSAATDARSVDKSGFDRRSANATQKNLSFDRQCRCVPAEGPSACRLQLWNNPSDRQIGSLAVGANTIFAGNLRDVILRRDSVERRAVRLRLVFEGAGPTFAKLAQQLSMRVDMLPYAYCVELAKMLDQASPIWTEQAIEIIERNLARPLEDVFETFDPIPIGSASLACVYQARLKTGDRVAVKCGDRELDRLSPPICVH